MGKKVYEVLPEMDLVSIEPYLATLQTNKPVRFMMNVVSRQSGKSSIFEISTYPSTLGIIIIVEDKTEEEQTKRLSTIGQVAGMVGHDLRNPLQTIIGEVYLARTELKTLPENEQKSNMQESIDSIAEQISYMDKIVSDLQTFVKPVELHKQTVNIKQLITGLLAQTRIPKTVKTNIHIESDTLNTDADPQLLKRVLINLVTNAMQAMPEGGELTLKAQSSDGGLTIVVEDTGVGIPDEIKPKLFTPLFTTKSMGQGFGLAVCRRVIEAHKGTITFESQVGKGTKFIVSLPQGSK